MMVYIVFHVQGSLMQARYGDYVMLEMVQSLLGYEPSDAWYDLNTFVAYPQQMIVTHTYFIVLQFDERNVTSILENVLDYAKAKNSYMWREILSTLKPRATNPPLLVPVMLS